MPPRIQPIDDGAIAASTRRIFEDAERRGAPNSTLLRILACHPKGLRAFYDGWQDTFYSGQVPDTLKELMRVRMARLRNCGY